MRRFEAVLGGLLLATWLASGLFAGGWIQPAWRVRFDLYGHFSFAAAMGWVGGNLALLGRRSEAPAARRWRTSAYLLLLAGPVMLLRALAPPELVAAAPLAGLYAGAIYALFALVPLSLRRR